MIPKFQAYLCAILMLLLSAQCVNKPKSAEDELSDTQKFIDSFKIARQADSMTKRYIRDALLDTTGISAAPVRVLSARLVTQEYSNYKDIRLTWKNVSTKKIAAVRFKWYGTNAFGEPADMGTSLYEGFGSGFSDDPLSPGRTDSGEWSIMSRDGKKVVAAWPYEVAFEDGTKWELRK